MASLPTFLSGTKNPPKSLCIHYFFWGEPCSKCVVIMCITMASILCASVVNSSQFASMEESEVRVEEVFMHRWVTAVDPLNNSHVGGSGLVLCLLGGCPYLGGSLASYTEVKSVEGCGLQEVESAIFMQTCSELTQYATKWKTNWVDRQQNQWSKLYDYLTCSFNLCPPSDAIL